jgi:hypothetical protein
MGDNWSELCNVCYCACCAATSAAPLLFLPTPSLPPSLKQYEAWAFDFKRRIIVCRNALLTFVQIARASAGTTRPKATGCVTVLFILLKQERNDAENNCSGICCNTSLFRLFFVEFVSVESVASALLLLRPCNTFHPFD